MLQQGQVFTLTTRGADGQTLWAYRYRVGGRGSKRVQRGGFQTERDARDALERELEERRRVNGIGGSLTLAELVDEYLAQHDAEAVTIAKLRWLLSKAVSVFGDCRLGELRPNEIAAWRMTISPGHRFEATQALRQVLARAVVWQMLSDNPARLGVDNPTRRRKEQRPFESWEELWVLAQRLGPQYGPMMIFAAATGLRPGEWIALERRDVDREARVVYVRRAVMDGRLKCTKTEASVRAVPFRRSRSMRSRRHRAARRRGFYFPRRAAAISTCGTSGTVTGSPPRSKPGSSHCDGSTICAIPSRHSRFEPESRRSIFPAIWARACS
jgi:integrase